MATDTIIKIPDIGGASGVDVIEIMVKPGDVIEVDTPLITLESDKASMEIPSTAAGVVESILIKLGDKVAEGTAILSLVASDVAVEVKEEVKLPQEVSSEVIDVQSKPAEVIEPTPEEITDNLSVFAGPGVRRLARVLDINLHDVVGTGLKSRITADDLEQFIKHKMQQAPSSAGGLIVPAAAEIDFSQFGLIERKPLNKIKRLTGVNVHRSYVTIPHVTQFDEADITELEQFRQDEAKNNKNSAVKLTILAFVCKVVTKALEVFPQFNASLDARGEELIYKQYFNIGIAVETPGGLVVPVINQVDKLTVSQIAQEMSRLSTKAREKGLMPTDMRGGCFTISSLGGIGGTAFTPIINSPEVAILGLSRSSLKPVYEDGTWKPRLMLPLSLSYDHRVIDGAEAARFTKYLRETLSDIRRILL